MPRRWEKAECVECGDIFRVDTTARNWKHIKYCSDDCRKAHAAQAKREQYKPKKQTKQQCIHCGKTFLPASNIGKRQKYCSRECFHEARRQEAHAQWSDERRTKKCAHCGKLFVPVKFSAGKQIYCSKDCQVAAIHKRHSGKYDAKGRRTTSYQQEFKVIKPVILDRDKQCVICGSTKKLHVHHLDNSGGSEQWNNSLDNLVALCADCHSAIHKITLVKIDGKWGVKGRIFEKLGLRGKLPIK